MEGRSTRSEVYSIGIWWGSAGAGGDGHTDTIVFDNKGVLVMVY